MPKKYFTLFIAIFLLSSMEFLQSGMIAFAAVPIRGEIQASPEEYSMVLALYACMAIISISNIRWFVERVGWRYYVVGSVGIYIVGGVVCSLGSDLMEFALGRAIMGLGGGSFFTIARILANVPAGPTRFSALKAFATGVALGTAASPLVASLAVTHDHWQAIFWVLMAQAGLAASLFLAYAPKDPLPRDQWASGGSPRILILALFSFFLLYALQRSYYDFYSDTSILIAFTVLSVFALYTYFYREYFHKEPLLKLRDVVNTRYIAGILLFCFTYLLIGANNYIQPQFLSVGLGYSWESIGWFQAISMLSTLATWFFMMWMLPRYPSPRKFWVMGFLALAIYAWKFTAFSPEANVWWDIMPAIAFSGAFLIFTMSTTGMQTFRDYANQDLLFAHAYQFKNMLGQIATAMGTSIATIFLQWRSTVQYGNLNIRFVHGDPLFEQELGKLSQYFALSHEHSVASQMAMAKLSQALSQQATLLAGIEYFWVVFWLAIVAVAFSVWQRVFR